MIDFPRRQAVVIGLFVALGALLLVGGVLSVGDIREMFGSKLVVLTRFDDAHGLQVGNNVWFSGVRVGTVRELRFGERAGIEVELAIDRPAAAHIPRDVLTKVGSDALLGNRIVVLYQGADVEHPIEEGALLRSGDAPSTDDMLATLQENNRNLLALTTDLRTVARAMAEGRGTAGQLLRDDGLYADLRSGASDLRSASADARDLTSSLRAFADDLNREGSLPRDLVTDRETYASIAASARHLEDATSRASGLLSGRDATGSPVATLLHDEQAGADLKATLENLDRSSRLLGEDLEALQHSFLLRRFFRKRGARPGKGEEQAPAPDPALAVGAPAVTGS